MTIDKLTPAQEAKLPLYVEGWLKVGLSTEQGVDMDSVISGIHGMYKHANEKPPAEFYVYSSPEEAILGIRLYEILDGEYIENPREFLKVADQDVLEQMKDSTKLTEHVNNFRYGNHDAHWVAFYSFFRNEVGIDGIEAVEYLAEISKNCGWYSLYEKPDGTGVVFVQRRPNMIKFDENNLQHCETGPSLTYSDGFSVYCWHGTQIPGEWIEDKSSITPEVLLRWENTEQRRCAAEIIGWANAIKLMKCTTINKNPNPMIGELLEVDIPEIGRERFLKVECGTGRDFALPVPPEMKTALQAQAWLNWATEDEILNLQVRT